MSAAIIQDTARGVPTLMLFKGGELKATQVGAVTKAQLTRFIEAQL